MNNEEIEEVNKKLRNQTPEEIIQWALSLNKKCIATTNFRPYESAILYAISETKKDLPVIWCDSGYNMRETYVFAEKLMETLGNNIVTYVPKNTVAHRNVRLGIPEVDTPAHNQFTEEVKIEPFRRAFSDYKPEVWITNLRQGQTALRNGLDILSIDGKGILKVCPFYYYSDEDLEQYLNDHSLPNEQKYYDPTKALDNRECGIHK